MNMDDQVMGNKEADKNITMINENKDMRSAKPFLTDEGLRELLESATSERPSMRREQQQNRVESKASEPSINNTVNSVAQKKQAAKPELPMMKIKARTIKPDRYQLRKNRILIDSEGERAAMAYKILRTKVYQEFTNRNWNSVGITSPNPSDGKTTTAINLAYTFARSVPNIVVLVDLDLHRPSVHKHLEFAPPYGVIDYLNGDVLISEVLYRIADTNMFVIPGRECKDLPMDLFSSDRLAKLHRFLNRMFPKSFLFYDLPPVLSVDDAVVFDEKDCNLVVTAEGSTSVDDLHNVAEMMTGHNLLGYVLNKSKHSTRIHKYGYSYYGAYGKYGNYTNS